MKRSRGTIFLIAALVACCAWLTFYSGGASVRSADRAVLERKPVTLPVDVLNRYSGDYELAGDIVSVRVRDGKLLARLVTTPPSPEIELLAGSETTFFIRDSDIDLLATDDGSGHITGFLLKQARGDRIVRKIR